MKREYRTINGTTERKCCWCEMWFPVSEFYKRAKSPDGLRAECVNCFSVSRGQYYQENKQVVLKRNKNYTNKNQDAVNAYKSQWQKDNSEKRRVRLNQRYSEEPNFSIAVNLRTRVIKAIGNNQKSGSTLETLGCSVEFFKNYIASMFIGKMSWSNHGEVWHIDHIKPCASFDLSNPDQQRICFHYKNMQPLLAKDNLKKGSKYLWT